MNVQSASLTTPHRAWLRIEDFLLLDGSGAFSGFSKTELIDGEILCINSQFQRHSYVKSELAFRLRTALGAETPMLVLVEVAIAMPPHDMPEPDIVVCHGPLGTGAVELPRVALVIEVADTTLDIDLGRKARPYARHAVPEYWVVDIAGQRIIGHARPERDTYALQQETPFGSDIAALTIAGLTLDTAKLA